MPGALLRALAPESGCASVPHGARRRQPPLAGRRGGGDRGLFPADGGRRGREPAAVSLAARRRSARSHGRLRSRAWLRRREGLRGLPGWCALRGSSLSRRRARAGRRARGGQARPAAHRRCERSRRQAPRKERRAQPRRDRERLRAFSQEQGAEPAESSSDAAECDVVVTVTPSSDPVLRGEWLEQGALVCAVGANDGRRRELDNIVLERAAFVCCDSLDDAKLESADLIEPVESGVLDWLEVHELQEVVGGQVSGRQSDEDIVVFKSNGLAAWDVAVAAAAVERARVAGAGTELS